MPGLSHRLCYGTVSLSLLASPTLAVAASAPSVSPFVAMSYLASDSSRAALCGVAGAKAAAASATGTTIAASTATTTNANGQPTPVNGCVLPIVDPAAVPVAIAAPVGPGFSLIGPLAAGLAGLVAILVIASAADNQDNETPPVSPS